MGLTHPRRLYSVRVETESDGTRRRTGGEVKGKETNRVGSQAVFSLTRNSPSSVATIVLRRPALQESQYSIELTPADINGLVRFAGRPNLVSARVASHSVFTLPRLTSDPANEFFG